MRPLVLLYLGSLAGTLLRPKIVDAVSLFQDASIQPVVQALDLLGCLPPAARPSKLVKAADIEPVIPYPTPRVLVHTFSNGTLFNHNLTGSDRENRWIVPIGNPRQTLGRQDFNSVLHVVALSISSDCCLYLGLMSRTRRLQRNRPRIQHRHPLSFPPLLGCPFPQSGFLQTDCHRFFPKSVREAKGRQLLTECSGSDSKPAALTVV